MGQNKSAGSVIVFCIVYCVLCSVLFTDKNIPCWVFHLQNREDVDHNLIIDNLQPYLLYMPMIKQQTILSTVIKKTKSGNRLFV